MHRKSGNMGSPFPHSVNSEPQFMLCWNTERNQQASKHHPLPDNAPGSLADNRRPDSISILGCSLPCIFVLYGWGQVFNHLFASGLGVSFTTGVASKASPIIPTEISLTVQFSWSVVSDSLQPHGLQHARPPCPSPTSRVYTNSHPLSWWCHPTISSSVIPFSSCLQSFSASGSFQMSQFFTSGGQSIGASASASVLPMNIQDWFPLGWTGWISLQSKGLSRVFSNTTVQKHQFFGTQLSL